MLSILINENEPNLSFDQSADANIYRNIEQLRKKKYLKL